jgi:hypothetical protein
MSLELWEPHLSLGNRVTLFRPTPKAPNAWRNINISTNWLALLTPTLPGAGPNRTTLENIINRSDIIGGLFNSTKNTTSELNSRNNGSPTEPSLLSGTLLRSPPTVYLAIAWHASWNWPGIKMTGTWWVITAGGKTTGSGLFAATKQLPLAFRQASTPLSALPSTGCATNPSRRRSTSPWQ